MELKVSIIVPVYNTEKYLHDCLQSVISQTYSNLEIILVDDGSTDASGTICDEYSRSDGRILVIHQQNSGAAAARNTGLRAMTGDWVTFVDSDDWVEPNMVECLVTAGEKQRTDIVSCSHFRNNKEKEVVAEPQGISSFLFPMSQYREQMSAACINTPYIYPELFPDEMRSGPTMRLTVLRLFRKKVIEDIFFSEGLALCEDRIFNLRALKKADSLFYINIPLYHYRFVDNSANHRNFSLLSKDYLKAFHAMQTEAENSNHPALLGKHVNIAIVTNTIVLIRFYVKDNTTLWNSLTHLNDFRMFAENEICRRAIEKITLQEMPNLRRRVSTFLLKRRLYFVLVICEYLYRKKEKA